MDIFGAGWTDHPQRVRENWLARVASEDLVLMPGDLSWAMTLEEAADDLAYLADLPGRILLVRGNHDYWWSSLAKVRRALPRHVSALQNDHYALPGGGAVCGTRGWDLPSTAGDPQDIKIYRREVGRLRLSLESARKAGLAPRIAMLHYPPTLRDGRRTEFSDLLEAYGVKVCVYGHLHGERAHQGALQGSLRGVRYHLVSCDALGCAPLEIEV